MAITESRLGKHGRADVGDVLLSLIALDQSPHEFGHDQVLRLGGPWLGCLNAAWMFPIVDRNGGLSEASSAWHQLQARAGPVGDPAVQAVDLADTQSVGKFRRRQTAQALAADEHDVRAGQGFSGSARRSSRGTKRAPGM
jgi:hypothetical protein